MPPTNAEKRVVLITGCSSGIGRATAERFHEAGCHVWATSRDPSDLEDLGDRGCRTAALDVTDQDQIASVVENVLARDGRIDCLVNNAGFGQAGAVEEVPIERLRDQFEVNTFGPVRVAQAVMPHMRASGGGTIVNVSSLLGRVTYPTRGAYAASKQALESLSDALRVEADPFDVSVVLVEPGSVRTDFDENLRETRDDINRVSEYGRVRRLVDRAQHLNQRWGIPPEAVAAVIVRAATSDSPNPRYVVGLDARVGILADRLLPDRVTDWVYRTLARWL